MEIKTTKQITLSKDEVIDAITSYVRVELSGNGVYTGDFTFLDEDVKPITLLVKADETTN